MVEFLFPVCKKKSAKKPLRLTVPFKYKTILCTPKEDGVTPFVDVIFVNEVSPCVCWQVPMAANGCQWGSLFVNALAQAAFFGRLLTRLE